MISLFSSFIQKIMIKIKIMNEKSTQHKINLSEVFKNYLLQNQLILSSFDCLLLSFKYI